MERFKAFPIYKQFYACSSVIIPHVVVGILEIGEDSDLLHYTSVVNAMVKNAAPSASDIVATIGCGLGLHYLGRKKCAVTMNLLFLVPLLIFSTDLSLTAGYVGLVVMHFAYQFATVTGNVIVAEMSEPRFRPCFIGLEFSAYFSGVLIKQLLNKFPTLPYLTALVFNVTGLILALKTPETPYWLALTGRLDESEDLFMVLRGPNANVADFDDMSDSAEADAEAKRAAGPVRIMAAPTFFTPLTIVCFTIMATYGLVFLTKQIRTTTLWTFKLQDPTDELRHKFFVNVSYYDYVTTLQSLVASLLFSLLALFLNQRHLFLTSTILGLFVIFSNLMAHFKNTTFLYFVLFSSFINFLGGRQVPHILRTEIFPGFARDLGVTVSELVERVISINMTYSSFGGEQSLYFRTFSTTLWVLIPIGLVFSWLFMPETKKLPLIRTEKLAADFNEILLRHEAAAKK